MTENGRMGSYQGSLTIAATSDVIEAVFDVTAGSLRVRAGGEELGQWPLSALSAEYHRDGVHLLLDGESVVVSVNDQYAFAAAVAVAEPRRGGTGRTRTPRTLSPRAERKDRVSLAERAQALAKVFDRSNWTRWLQDRTIRWSIASMGVIFLALFALFATNTFGMILVLLGMVALIVAALAVSEDLSAYRVIPDALSETALVIIGAVAILLGALLILVA